MERIGTAGKNRRKNTKNKSRRKAMNIFLTAAESRIGAWSSPQSEVIKNREMLEKNVAEFQQ